MEELIALAQEPFFKGLSALLGFGFLAWRFYAISSYRKINEQAIQVIRDLAGESMQNLTTSLDNIGTALTDMSGVSEQLLNKVGMLEGTMIRLDARIDSLVLQLR